MPDRNGSSICETVTSHAGPMKTARARVPSPELPSFKPADVLLMEDNEDHIELTELAFQNGGMLRMLHVARDGVAGMAFLRRELPFLKAPRPDLILLDLNMPCKDGREVLVELKADDDLRRIPVVILTTSEAEADVLQAYNLHANAYIIKPVEFSKFVDAARQIAQFWFALVRLPPQGGHGEKFCTP